MKIEFTNGGIRYSLLVRAAARNEPLIEPSEADKKVWANEAQKHRFTGGLEDRPERHVAEAQVSDGRKLRRRPVINYRRPPAEHFLESAPAD